MFTCDLTQTKQGLIPCSCLSLLPHALPPYVIHCVGVPGDDLGCLGCQKRRVGLAASIRFSLQSIILSVDEGPTTPKSGSSGFVANVSVTDFFFLVKSC